MRWFIVGQSLAAGPKLSAAHFNADPIRTNATRTLPIMDSVHQGEREDP